MSKIPAQRRDTMDRLIVRALVLTALLIGASAPAHAGSEGRKGTDGALELRIPVGARGTALGGAVVGDASGVEAIYWNPAGLASLQHTEAMFTHTAFFAEQKLNYAAIASNLGAFGVLGFNAKVLSVGDVIVTTEDAPEGTGEIAQPTFTVLGLSWAKQFTDRVMFGVTANYVNERIITQSASGVAFDFGVQYLTGWNGLKVGMVMKNFGPSMAFSGPGSEISVLPPGSDPSAVPRIFNSESASFEMPSFFSLAASADMFSSPQYRLTALGSFQNNNFEGDELRGGLEWGYRDLFALRGSYFGAFNNRVDLTTGDETVKFRGGDDLYTGVALGAGARIRTGDTARLGVDLTWRPVRQGLFDDIFDLGVRLGF